MRKIISVPVSNEPHRKKQKHAAQIMRKAQIIFRHKNLKSRRDEGGQFALRTKIKKNGKYDEAGCQGMAKVWSVHKCATCG